MQTKTWGSELSGTPDVAKIAEQGASPSNRMPEIVLFVPVLDSTHGCPQGWTRTVGEIFHSKFNITGKYEYDIMPLADDTTVTASMLSISIQIQRSTISSYGMGKLRWSLATFHKYVDHMACLSPCDIRN